MKKSGLFLILIMGWVLLGATLATALEGEMADEFAYLSGQTRQAMEFSSLELEGLLERCDRLLEKTDNLKTTEKKIMRRKIERLRGLFLYVLQSKHVVREE